MKLFVLASRVPWPLEKGDKVRIYHQVRQLSKHHEVILCCLSDKEVHPEARKELSLICAELHIIQLSRVLIVWRMFLALWSRRPYQVHYFYQSNAAVKIHSLIRRHEPDHLYCQLIRTTEYVKHLHHIPKTLDYMDAFNKGLERRILSSPWYLKPFVKSEFRRVAGYEHLIFDYFDHHTIISEQDRQFIYHSHRNKIRVIPNGIDGDWFSPRKMALSYDIVFTGNMSYPPNISGAIYLIDEILPKLLLQYPDLKVLIAGVDPPGKLLDRAGKQVHVSGWVKDIRDAYASARVFVAPMQIGTGLQNKLLEAMAMGLPCVTSELANNALKAIPEKSILIGRSPEDYANQISRLLRNPELAASIAAEGRKFALEGFSWEASTAQLEELMENEQMQVKR